MVTTDTCCELINKKTFVCVRRPLYFYKLNCVIFDLRFSEACLWIVTLRSLVAERSLSNYYPLHPRISYPLNTSVCGPCTAATGYQLGVSLCKEELNSTK
jgi:hypothetical protein